MVWDRFIDGKGADHVEVVEDRSRYMHPDGTMEVELAARESERRAMKARKVENANDEL